MKKILIVFLFLTMMAYTQNAVSSLFVIMQQTKISGRLEGYAGELVRIQMPDGSRDTVKVKSDGSFSYVVSDRVVGSLADKDFQGGTHVFQIVVKNHSPWIPVFIGKGELSHVILTLQGEQVTALYAGKRKAENEMLLEMQRFDDRSLWQWEDIAKMSFAEYRKHVDDEVARCQQLFARIQNADSKQELADLLTLNTTRKMVEYETPYSYINHKRLDENSEYGQYISQLQINNPRTFDNRLLGSILSWYLSLRPDYETVESEGKRQVLLFDLAKSKVGNASMVDQFMAEEIRNRIDFGSIRDYTNVMEKFRELCSDANLYAEVKAEYNEYMRAHQAMDPGMPAPNFEMIDTEGNKVKLSDLRGKLLYIDIWGTWCIPCIEEMPHLSKLQERFKDDPRILIMSISVDPNINTWKRFLDKRKPIWKQYIVDKQNNAILDKDYRVFGIPRFILINKEGNFVKADAMRPSFGGMKEYLEDLLDPRPYDKDELMEKVYNRFKEDTITTADQYYSLIFPRIESTVLNEEYSERLKADVMLQLFDMSGTYDPKSYLDYFLKYCKTDSLRQKVLSHYDEYVKANGHLFPGQPAPDFTFKNEKGKLIRLSDLRGKLLFIDIWGTWCVPCIEEIPYLNKLQEKYKNNKNVHIMSIACDKESARPKWLAFLKKHKEMNWAQYQVTTEGNKILDDVYHVMGIPRFMIIDKDGIIIDADAPRPSFDTFNAFFDNIVNKL